jgi:hypothetical protein
MLLLAIKRSSGQKQNSFILSVTLEQVLF